MAGPDLLHEALAAWRVNNAVNLFLIDTMPAAAFDAVPLASRGRNIAQQFCHVHKSRVAWLKLNRAPEMQGLPIFEKSAAPSRAQLKSALTKSGNAVEKFVERMITNGKRIKMFRGQTLRWLFYVVNHEAHHRGSIMLTLKQNGMRMKDEDNLKGVWYPWDFGLPEERKQRARSKVNAKAAGAR